MRCLPISPAFPAALVSAVVLATAPAVPAQTLDKDLWITDGTVFALGIANGTLYLGGSFNNVGPNAGPAVATDAATGTVLTHWPVIQYTFGGTSKGTVSAIVPDGSGGWYIGGQFTAVGGVARGSCAHIDAAGHLTAWDPSPGGTVNCLALDNGIVYIGGTFSSVGGQARYGIAAVDAVTGIPTAWNPHPSSTVNFQVTAITVAATTVYVAGHFPSIGGQDRNGLAALDKTTGLATSWDPDPFGDVLAIAVDGDLVYVGGTFYSIGGSSVNSLAAIRASDGTATSWDPVGLYNSPTINAIAIDGNYVYVGGSFSTIGGKARNNLAAISTQSGNARTSWNPDADGKVLTLVRDGSTTYVGGWFSHVGGQTRHYAAALDANGAAAAWNPSPDNVVRVLAAGGGSAALGGDFWTVAGLKRTHLAALDLETRTFTDWSPSTNGLVTDLVVHDGLVYLGGAFTEVSGAPRPYLAAVDAVTGAVGSWSPDADDEVDALAISGNTVYAGGKFQMINGFYRKHLAAMDAVTGIQTPWEVHTDQDVRALAVDGNTVYVGGMFQYIGAILGGTHRNHLAAVDAATGAVTAWNPNPDNTVYTLAVDQGMVFAGGSFTAIGPDLRYRLASVDPVTGSALAWNPQANSYVFSLIPLDGKVIAGGGFTQIGGQGAGGAGILDKGTGNGTGWDPGINGTVLDIAVYGDAVYLGGTFKAVHGEPRLSLARFTSATTAVSDAGPAVRGLLVRAPSPNPGHGRRTVQFEVPKDGDAELSLVDVAGRRVFSRRLPGLAAGPHEVTLNEAAGLPGGIYFVRIVQGGAQGSVKMVVTD